MKKKTVEIKTRISPKLNTLRAIRSPRTRQFADLPSHAMVNRVLKPHTIQVSLLISIIQTAQALGNIVRLGYEGQGSKARLILTFVEDVRKQA